MKAYDAGLQTDVAILDFSEAFDTVPHKNLLSKMDSYGIREPINNWLNMFLTHRKMKAVVEGEQSEEVAVYSGVPQGTVLGSYSSLVTQMTPHMQQNLQ
jgi:galactokinase/mevalonate kinase-like predicted kinase